MPNRSLRMIRPPMSTRSHQVYFLPAPFSSLHHPTFISSSYRFVSLLSSLLPSCHQHCLRALLLLFAYLSSYSLFLMLKIDEWKVFSQDFLFLEPPREFCETINGTLLLDATHKHKLFVKGFWICDLQVCLSPSPSLPLFFPSNHHFKRGMRG